MIEEYSSFPLLILINKRLRHEKVMPIVPQSQLNEIYSSNNYSLYYKKPANEICKGSHPFGCSYTSNSSVIISIPESAYKYYYGPAYNKTQDGFILVNTEPNISQDALRLLLLLLSGTSYLILIACIYCKILTKHK